MLSVTVSLLFLLLLNVVGAKSFEMYLDLSHDLSIDSMRWPSSDPFQKTTITSGMQEGGFWLENNKLNFGEHISTHIDAPSHFYEGGITVDEIPLENLISRPAIKIDIRDKAAKDSLATLNVTDIEDWIELHGEIPANSIVFVWTGWDKRYGDLAEYYGTTKTENVGYTDVFYPGIDLEAAQYLSNYGNMTGRSVVGVGLDTPSVDAGGSTTFDTHVELCSNGIYSLENVANLAKLPAKGAEVTVMPIKTKGGSGGPTRIVARIALAHAGANSNRAVLLWVSTSIFFVVYKSF